MSANEIECTGMPLPRIASIKTRYPHLVVTWAEGRRADKVDIIDLGPIIQTYKVFRPLRKDAKLFKAAYLIDDGDAVAWDERDLQLSADTLEGLAEEIMTPEDFVEFMKRHTLTEEGMAAILGYSRRQIGYFKTKGPIPRVVALACKGYEVEHPVQQKQIRNYA